MAQQVPNPFQNIQINVPVEYRETLSRYSQAGQEGANPDLIPFPRMIDMWYLSICVAAKLGLTPINLTGHGMHHFIDGSILGGDNARIQNLQLIAIAHTKDADVVKSPTEMMRIAHGLAAAGLPEVIDMLEGNDDPIHNLSEKLVELLGRSGVGG